MNKLILCEGETDAILLSYYLGKIAGWQYVKKAPKWLEIKTNTQNQSANWYQKGNDYLLICAVGGKDNFKHFFDEKISSPILLQNAFDKIAIVTDRDNRKIQEIEVSVNAILESISAAVINNSWTICHYTDSFNIGKTLEILLVIIPAEHQGALETAMLDAISENEYDRIIVERAGCFAKQMRTVASKYISSDRLELKAHLGLTWAVQYPEKVFTAINAQIKSVCWEKYDSLKKCFSALVNI